MNKIILSATIIATIIFSASICAANDVWLERRQSEGVEVYVMDDTIIGKDSRNYFSVSVKQVRNGRLDKIVIWKFSKFRDDMWRYETSLMDGSHTTVVSPRNKIFEFCMAQLGWSYKIVDMWYY